jgi:hypothetical protein
MSEVLKKRKDQLLEAEREESSWKAFLDSERGKKVIKFFEDEFVATFDECDTMRAVAANAAKRKLIKKFFSSITYSFSVRDHASKSLRDMLSQEEEIPEKYSMGMQSY